MVDKPKQIEFKYKISPNFNVYSVSGGYGGISAQGEIVLNFYHERAPIPKTQTFEIMPDGSLNTAPIAEDRERAFIRDVIFGISVTPFVARSLAQWLNEKVDAYEKERLAQRKKDNELH